jgi:protocatechuate 3,4-dioxygenase beta subunit
VDIWHCDASGVYSDVSDPSFNTMGQKFLRGYQVTDGSGSVRFSTIYPGWYSGRAVHIHFKIRLFAGPQKTYEFTSQLYFDDSLTDRVHSQPPYNSKGTRHTRNSQDGIFSEGGSQLLLDLTQTSQGYSAMFDIGLKGNLIPTQPHNRSDEKDR